VEHRSGAASREGTATSISWTTGGPDGAAMILVAGTPVEIGVLMDYSVAGEGAMDDVKIDGTVLDPDDRLLAPEPGTAALFGLGLLLLATRARRS
jgi:hypothetical protein